MEAPPPAPSKAKSRLRHCLRGSVLWLKIHKNRAGTWPQIARGSCEVRPTSGFQSSRFCYGSEMKRGGERRR